MECLEIDASGIWSSRLVLIEEIVAAVEAITLVKARERRLSVRWLTPGAQRRVEVRVCKLKIWQGSKGTAHGIYLKHHGRDRI